MWAKPCASYPTASLLGLRKEFDEVRSQKSMLLIPQSLLLFLERSLLRSGNHCNWHCHSIHSAL